MTTDERLLSTDTATAVINAPIARVDIGDWLFHLPDAEYQRCAPGQHIAAGVTTTDGGRPLSINVEQIAGTLLVQHYVPEVLEAPPLRAGVRDRRDHAARPDDDPDHLGVVRAGRWRRPLHVHEHGQRTCHRRVPL